MATEIVYSEVDDEVHFYGHPEEVRRVIKAARQVRDENSKQKKAKRKRARASRKVNR